MKILLVITLLVLGSTSFSEPLTPDQLVLRISTHCFHRFKWYSKDDKIDCMEYLVNCSIKWDGKIDSDNIDWCIQHLDEPRKIQQIKK